MSTKKVTYRGCTYDAPKWTRFIAMDSDGTVFAYAERPNIDAKHDQWEPSVDRYGQYTATERLSLNKSDWRDSLEEIE